MTGDRLLKEATPETARLWAAQVGGIDAERFNNVADALARLLEVERAAKEYMLSGHQPGCMEPGLQDDDCVCGYTALRRLVGG